MYKKYFKRILDIFISFTFLIIVSPLLILVTLVVAIKMRNPFFVQERPGKNEKKFNILKFKTMNNKKDKLGELLPDIQRITVIGALMRKTSFDEIPQLINVLKGDMSIIGPRPLRTFYLPYYTGEEKMRHNVRPGITGLAQVSGRNFIKWEKRFEYDVSYVKNLSLKMDVEILFQTIKKVFNSSDVAVNPDEFVERFDIYRQKQIENRRHTI